MRKNKGGKLYSAVRDLRLPDGVRRYAENTSIIFQRLHTTAFVTWPSGKPCLPVIMYLLDNGYKWTGDTAITYASALSELIRHCARVGKKFGELHDDDIYSLVETLRGEVRLDDPHQRVRNDNTVREIIGRCIEFLFWYQRSLYRGASPLIGEQGEAPAIVCEQKKNPHNGHYYWVHRYARFSNSTEPKLPIGLRVIDDIEATIDRLGNSESYPEAAVRPYQGDRELFESVLDYRFERRTFMVWMMKRTGMRPEELSRIPADEAAKAVNSGMLSLCTMKRRKNEPPLRSFPLNARDCRAVMRYLAARRRWVEVCTRREDGYAEPVSLFLSTEPGNVGRAIAKSGLAKDFEVLCAKAGYADQQACFSMFRHRFITYEVLAHIKEWEERKGPVATKEDYLAILERVRVKTGHGSAMSLWHYIDFARDMEGVWANVDKATAKLHAADHLKRDLELLRRDLSGVDGRRMAANQVLDLVCGRLNEIICDARKGGMGEVVAA